MPHEHVYGICENKCLIEVEPKENTDAVEQRVTTLENTAVKVGETINGTLEVSEGFHGVLYVKGETSEIEQRGSVKYLEYPSQTVNYIRGCENSSIQGNLIVGSVPYNVTEEITYPFTFTQGIYIKSEEDLTDELNHDDIEFTVTFTGGWVGNQNGGTSVLYVNGVETLSISINNESAKTKTCIVHKGDVITVKSGYYVGGKITIEAKPIYINVTP